MTKQASPATSPLSDSHRRQGTLRMELMLPVKMAAQVAALHEMHKEKSLDQIAMDLLVLGLAQLEAARPHSPPAEQMQAPQHQTVYLLSGPFSEFEHLVVKHHLRMERELAGDDFEARAASDPYDLNADSP